MLIAIQAYFERRAWAAWATGNVARGAVERFEDLLPKPPETIEEREMRVDRNIDQLNMRFAAMAEADQSARGEA